MHNQLTKSFWSLLNLNSSFSFERVEKSRTSTEKDGLGPKSTIFTLKPQKYKKLKYSHFLTWPKTLNFFKHILDNFDRISWFFQVKLTKFWGKFEILRYFKRFIMWLANFKTNKSRGTASRAISLRAWGISMNVIFNEELD